MINRQLKGWVLAGILLGLAACQSPDPVRESGPDPKPVGLQTEPYSWQKPTHFPDPVYDFTTNPLTREGVLLGKTLFYDSQLSANGTISCGFCHSPYSAFAHTDHALSHGINDQVGTRNVPSIQNVAWSTHFFWDGGITQLDLLPLAPIQDPVEMGDSLPHVLNKIRASPAYRSLFESAYGSEEVNTERMLKALSQFMLTMVSANAKYDRYVQHEAGSDLTDNESRGLALFQQHCAGCHQGSLFTDHSFRNNGLPPLLTTKGPDAGRQGITLLAANKDQFKVPSLRNVQMTPPYMHDGRFKTLEQVLHHYATGVTDSPTLDPLLKRGEQKGILLSAQEQRDLIQFLTTLTDYSFINKREFQPD